MCIVQQYNADATALHIFRPQASIGVINSVTIAATEIINAIVLYLSPGKKKNPAHTICAKIKPPAYIKQVRRFFESHFAAMSHYKTMTTRIIINPMNPGAKFGFSVIVEVIPTVNTSNPKIWKNVRIRKITSSLSYADEN